MEDNKLKNQIGNSTLEDIRIGDDGLVDNRRISNAELTKMTFCRNVIESVKEDKSKNQINSSISENVKTEDCDLLSPSFNSEDRTLFQWSDFVGDIAMISTNNLKDILLKEDNISTPSVDKLKSQVDNTIKNIPTTKKRYTLIEMIEKFKENNKLKFKDLDSNVVIYLRGCGSILMFEFEEPGNNVSLVGMPIGNCYELIEEPVTFKEVLNSDKKCRVEHELIEEILNTSLSYYKTCKDLIVKIKNKEFIYFDDLMYLISKSTTSDILREIIKNGKWYLEE